MSLRAARAVVLAIVLGGAAAAARAQDAAVQPAQGPEPEALNRPEIGLIRWQEDWSALADPALRLQPIDALKHVALSGEAGDYVSFGLNARERFEHQDARGFGVIAPGGDYLLNRLQAHVDVRYHDRLEAFVQLEEVTAPGLAHPGPADENKGDLRQAFVAYRGQGGDWRYVIRVGRQEVAFDLERFVSIREGPNVRQAFDAVQGELDHGAWSARLLISHPVQYKPGAFDDLSDRHLAFDALRLERHGLGPGSLSVYVARYVADGSHLGDLVGRERRDIVDVRYFKPNGQLQYDLEGMRQTGAFAGRVVDAWAVGARTRYQVTSGGWRPKLGLQIDVASGDKTPRDLTIGTFNPLFSNGLYFTQADYTTYANLIHVKPTLTLDPTPAVTLLAGVGVQWRETTGDAVYVQPSIPIPGTAGGGGRYTGAYAQGRGDWRITPNARVSLEMVHFAIGSAIHRAGGHDADYVAAELALAW